MLFAVVAILLPSIIFLLCPGASHAATLTVDVLTDTGGGGCELRAAIDSVNAQSDQGACVSTGVYGTTDTIEFDAALTGTITLGSTLSTLTLSVSIPAPTLPITIDGNGNGIFTFDSATDDQLFIITGLSLTNGGGAGGAALNVETGDFVLLTLCSLTDNHATTGALNEGGAVRNHGGLVGIGGCLISENSSDNEGGAIFNDGGMMLLAANTISHNTVGSDAGFHNGGAIRNVNGGTITVAASTLNGNSAKTSDGNGGAISNNAGAVTILDSTISGNSASNDGAGIHNENAGTVTLNNTTVVENFISGLLADNNGGGIFNDAASTVTLSNTILARNAAGILGSGPDCFTDVAAPLDSADHNLIQDTSDCPIGGTTTNNILGVDPMIGPLTDNGGLTATHALLQGSPAIDLGNPNTPDAVLPNCETIDQRDVARPQIYACDIGAFEYAEFADLQIFKWVDNPSAGVGDTVTFTVTVENHSTDITSLNVDVGDIISGPIDVTAISGTNFVCSGNIGDATGGSIANICHLDSLAPGASESFTLVGDVLDTNQIANFASVSSSGTHDPFTADNIANATVEGSDPIADLSMNKSADVAQAPIGATVTFTLAVNNLDASEDAAGVVINDYISGPFQVTDAVFTIGTGSCTPTSGDAPLIITCIPNGSALFASGNAEIEVTGTVTGLGQIDNTGSISSSGTLDNDLSNNLSAAMVTGIAQSSDLSLSKTVNVAEAEIGDTDAIVFTITVTNDGPDEATAVKVLDTVTGTDIFEINTTEVTQGAGCSVSPGAAVTEVSCELGAIPDQGSATITITGTAVAEGTIDNFAAASDTGGNTDSSLANNYGGASLNAVPVPVTDLQVVKTVDQAEPTIGDIVTFTVTVTNNGPDAAEEVVLSDSLSGAFNVLVTAITPEQGTCTQLQALPPIYECELGAIDAGESVTVEMTGLVIGGGLVENTSQVVDLGGTDDPDSANNSSEASFDGIFPPSGPPPAPAPEPSTGVPPTTGGPSTVDPSTTVPLATGIGGCWFNPVAASGSGHALLWGNALVILGMVLLRRRGQ